MIEKKCPSCGKKAHNFELEEAFNCVPPKEVLKFGAYIIDNKYRKTLYKEHPYYNSEEVVGSFLGHNPYFPGQEEWLGNKTN